MVLNHETALGYIPTTAIDSVVGELGISPSAEQWNVLRCPNRTILVAGGERGGKSWVSGLFGATRTPFGKLFWIVAASYELARPEFNYWISFLDQLGAFRDSRDISVPRIGQAQAKTRSGQIIVTKTADDVKKLAATAPDGIIMAEAAQMSYDVFLKCNGRVSERRGWLLMSGTFEDSADWYAEMYSEFSRPNIYNGISFSLPTWSNLKIFPGGREDAELKRLEIAYSRVEGLFEERCGAVPVPPSTLVFREFRHTVHVSDEPNMFDPKLPVYLAIDPSSGGDPYAVLPVQFKERIDFAAPSLEGLPKAIRGRIDKIDDGFVIDEFYETKADTEEIIAHLKHKSWWKNVRGGAIDPEAPDEKRRWSRYGGVPLVSKKVEQLVGIRRLKSFLYYRRGENGLIVEPPYLHIHKSAHNLIYELTHYKRKTADAKLNPIGTVIEKPPQNQLDHAIKALWYLLVVRYGDVRAPAKAKVSYTWKRPRF